MIIRNSYLSIAYKTLFILLSAWGLALVLAIEPGFFNPSVLIYYTVLSNILCLLYFSGALVHNTKTLRKTRHAEAYRPRLQVAVLFSITVTILIYHFMLTPIQFAMGNISQIYAKSNILLHYILPLMTLFDWLLFCPKGRLKIYDPLWWLIFPFAYFIFTLIRAQAWGGHSRTQYPLPIRVHGR